MINNKGNNMMPSAMTVELPPLKTSTKTPTKKRALTHKMILDVFRCMRAMFYVRIAPVTGSKEGEFGLVAHRGIIESFEELEIFRKVKMYPAIDQPHTYRADKIGIEYPQVLPPLRTRVMTGDGGHHQNR